MNFLSTATDASYEQHPQFGVRLLAVVQITWMTVVLALSWALGMFSFETYYILSYLGLVVGAALFAPVESTPRWWRSVQWLIRLGFLGLVYFIATRVNDVIQL